MNRRTPIIAGNWKMNTTREEARSLIEGIVASSARYPDVEQVVCPPAVYLMLAAELTRGSPVKVGAQNMFWEHAGAYTGECSPAMIAEFCQYVIVGHSERRRYFHETDEDVNRKVRAALAAGLRPIMCVGETLDERQAGKTAEVLTRQLRNGLAGVDVDDRLVVAYEPIWAIGTGVAATPEMANEAIARVRGEIAEVAGAQVASAIRIQYGGSVSPGNAGELLRQPEIDGALVGGASLKADSFLSIIAQAQDALAGK
jgi:triosephosphate isomerase